MDDIFYDDDLTEKLHGYGNDDQIAYTVNRWREKNANWDNFLADYLYGQGIPPWTVKAILEEHARHEEIEKQEVEIGKCYKYKDGAQEGQYIGKLESYTLETEEGHAARRGGVEAAAEGDATYTRGILRRTHSEEDEAQCPICFEIMNDPVTLLCGHSACMNCIHMLIVSPAPNNCMTCRHPIAPAVHNDLHVNIFMRDYINRRYPDEMRRRDAVRKAETREFVFVFNDGGEMKTITGEDQTLMELEIEETHCPDDVGSNIMHKGGKRKSRRNRKSKKSNKKSRKSKKAKKNKSRKSNHR